MSLLCSRTLPRDKKSIIRNFASNNKHFGFNVFFDIISFMQRESLIAEKRTVTGKKVRFLRREGVLPANIYGKDFKSLSIQLPIKDFINIYNKVHETGLVDLKVGSDNYPVLIQNVHIEPLNRTPLHADFFKVNLKEKVKSAIPVVAVGEPKAVTDKIGVLLQTLNEVEVEALPADLPENIEINVENLANIDDQITVEEVKTPNGVSILSEPSQPIFRIGELVSEEAEELAAEEEAAAEAASEEAAAEVEQKPEEGKADESKDKESEGSEEAPKEQS